MSKKKRVTSYDVAKEAGVSQSAVSRVFLQGRSVSQKTRDKVLETANRLGYRPNAIARTLITRRSGMVAVIVSAQANLVFPEVLSQLTKRLAENDERVLLFNLDHEDELDQVMEQIWTYQVDGVIALAAHFDHSRIQQFKDHHIPVVLFNRKVADHTASSVCCNHEQGIRHLVNKVADANHSHVLIVAGPKDSEVAQDRLAIALQCLKARGIDNPPVIYGDYSYQSGRDELHAYLAKHPRPTAIISGNDGMAFGIIDEARENFGLNIPQDLSVVGFDGVASSQWFNYRLTTIKQPLEQMTKAAVDMLMEQIEQPDEPAQMRLLAGHVIQGNTVADLKK